MQQGLGQDAAAAVDSLGALWSADVDRYACGEIDARSIRCVLCEQSPCQCPPFGSAEYFALMNRRHGKGQK